LFLPQLQIAVLIIGTGLSPSRSAHDEEEFTFSPKYPKSGEAYVGSSEPFLVIHSTLEGILVPG
jgi:hypothetical protein